MLTNPVILKNLSKGHLKDLGRKLTDLFHQSLVKSLCLQVATIQ